MARRTPFLALTLAAATVAPMSALSVNAGYTGFASGTSATSTARQVTGTCAFHTVPLEGTNTAMVFMEGAAVATGTDRSVRTTVWCRFVDNDLDPFEVDIQRAEPLPFTVVNGSLIIADEYLIVCVRSEAFYSDAARVNQTEVCEPPLPPNPLD